MEPRHNTEYPDEATAPSAAIDSRWAKLRNDRKGWVRLGVFAVVTAGVFYLLSREIDYSSVWATLRGADPVLLGLAALCTVTFPLLAAFRWRRMLASLGYSVSLRECFNMIMAAWPMGTITPSKSGDLMKAYYLKDRIPPALVVGSVLAERTMDVLCLLALALVGCLAFQRYGLALLAGAGLAAGVLALVIMLRFRLPLPGKLRGKAEPMLRSLRLISRSPSLLGWVILFTVLNWFASILQVALAYLALGTPVPLFFTAGALPLAIFVGLLPLTLSGMGTRDSAMMVLFAPYAPANVSLGVGILYSLFGYWLPALVGLPFLHRALPRGGPDR